ncbi:MAG: hypothetical protein EOO50_07215 [Flavobacterium sp.]|uniref:hypothetical protein n=1 Tax=Flavobacterium sp. TaxID=239 RepID=UPI00121E0D99|nr:hypothetical protein [Flavobacterium sp.]RZJ67045.1 MAG: hypothetical protein EOO50_07215 [Flavobacterium sp.]
MKKFSITLASALVLGLSFTSCGSDDNGGGGSVTAEKLAGKWEFSKEKFSINGTAFPEQDYSDNEAGCSKDYITFTAAGTYEEGDYWSTECELDTWDGTYTISGKDIIVDGETFNVQTLSGSTLKMKTTYTEEDVTYTGVVTLKKVN